MVTLRINASQLSTDYNMYLCQSAPCELKASKNRLSETSWMLFKQDQILKKKIHCARHYANDCNPSFPQYHYREDGLVYYEDGMEITSYVSPKTYKPK